VAHVVFQKERIPTLMLSLRVLALPQDGVILPRSVNVNAEDLKIYVNLCSFSANALRNRSVNKFIIGAPEWLSWLSFGLLISAQVLISGL